MPRYKKQYPLAVLINIENLYKEVTPFFEPVDSVSLLRFNDKDLNSDFYFEICDYKMDNGPLQFTIRYKPTSGNNLLESETIINEDKLLPKLKNWNNVLQQYDQVKIFSDPILKQYQDEFLNDFEILDEDADVVSFDYKTQLLIDGYLDFCESKLLENPNLVHKEEVEKIVEEISVLKKGQTGMTKRKVVEKLARIWARIRKVGLPLIKEIYQEAKKEVIKQIVKGQIDLL